MGTSISELNRTIYLHCGTHKTGSTSIQYTLFNNREYLLGQGIHYFSACANHSQYLGPFINPDFHQDILGKSLGLCSRQDTSREGKRAIQTLLEELKQSDKPKFIISAEGLSTCSEDRFQTLKALLDPYASKYKVIIYVREPIGYCLSKAQQELKTICSYDSILIDNILPKYRSKIEPAVNVFGKSNVNVRVFDRETFLKGDLICDFLDAIDEPTDLLNNCETSRRNQSLSQEALEIIGECNRRVPYVVDDRINELRHLKPHHLTDMPGTKFSLPNEIIESVILKSRPDIEWLHEFIGQDIFNDVSYDDRDAQPVLNKQVAKFLATKLNEMYGQLERYKDVSSQVRTRLDRVQSHLEQERLHNLDMQSQLKAVQTHRDTLRAERDALQLELKSYQGTMSQLFRRVDNAWNVFRNEGPYSFLVRTKATLARLLGAGSKQNSSLK